MSIVFVCSLLVLFVWSDEVVRKKHCTGSCQTYDKDAIMMSTTGHNPMHEKMKIWQECAEAHLCPFAAPNLNRTNCVNGMAGEYPCSNADILSFVNLASLGASGDGNDIWGWTDPHDNKEYAISCVYNGVSFVDVTSPSDPKVLGFLKTQTVSSSWRDVKVYKNYAFIVSEAANHGMQIFDLTQLRSLPRFSLDFENQSVRAVAPLLPTAHYSEFGSAHNLVINEESGFAYAVGSRTCRSGLHIVDIRNPLEPTFAGCYADDGYVHDAQCVIYTGPDTRYTNKEVCFCYDEDTLTIVDVTNKSSIVLISRTPYVDSRYTHQGWLFGNMKYLLLNDELDELNGNQNFTRTLVWNVENLRSPVHTTNYFATEWVIDHNLYTIGNRAFLANYCGGLRVLDLSNVGASNEITEEAFLDVSPNCNTATFLGSWSSYPYFPSGNVVVNSIDRGLFVVKLNL